MKQSMQVITSSESNEWYTPPPILDLVREVMGSIELDPASSPLANITVGAERYFDEQDDGLTKAWEARTLFLNPPYGKTGNKSTSEIWAIELLDQYLEGNVKEAILLTKTVPGYEWWDWMFQQWPSPMCITRGRIAFVRPEWIEVDIRNIGLSVAGDGTLDMSVDGKYRINWPERDNRSKAASSLWYLGNNASKFTEVFSRIGRVIPSGVGGK